jgi:hypothetical protein
MCGKPRPKGFRIAPHSDTICRILFRPETARFRRRRQPHGNQLIPVIVVSRGPNTARRGFGGFPWAQPSSVHVTYRYAYQEAGWLVPAKALIDRLTDRAHIITTGTDSYRFRRTTAQRKASKS